MNIITKEDRILLYEGGDWSCGNARQGRCRGRILRNAPLPKWARAGLERGQWLVVDSVELCTNTEVKRNRFGIEERVNSCYPKVTGKLVTPQVARVPQTESRSMSNHLGLVRTTETWDNIFMEYGDVRIQTGSSESVKTTEVLLPKSAIEDLQKEANLRNEDQSLITSTLELTGSKWKVDLNSIPSDRMADMHFRDRIYTRIKLIQVSVYSTREIDNSWYVDMNVASGTAELRQKTMNYLGSPNKSVLGDSIEVDGELVCTNEFTTKSHRCGWDSDGDAIYNDPTHNRKFTFFWEGGQVDVG